LAHTNLVVVKDLGLGPQILVDQHHSDLEVNQIKSPCYAPSKM